MGPLLVDAASKRRLSRRARELVVREGSVRRAARLLGMNELPFSNLLNGGGRARVATWLHLQLALEALGVECER